ncbi:hypothetical protein K474DRAFT_1667556 [Panus rudis PR-1116 ss-1]|nr:hypothetical protein K474DRAFT_1667556 [Panus rudis PR-1116 ss-1]
MFASCSRNVVRNSARASVAEASSATRSTPAVTFLHGRIQQQTRGAKHQGKAKKPKLTRPEFRYSRDEEYGLPPPPPIITRPVGTTLAKVNFELSRLVDKQRAVEAFELCRKMKEDGLAPDSTTYDQLLLLCAKIQAPTEAMAIFEDMRAMGIYPERETFHHLLLASFAKPIQATWTIWDMMESYDIAPNQKTFEIYITRLLQSNNLEGALRTLGEMSKLGLSPSLRSAQGIISLACELSNPRLALDLAEAYESTSVRRLEGYIWMDILIASTELFYAEGVVRCWQKAVKELNITPDEGCIVGVLNTAGVHGLAALATDALETLKLSGVDLEEHHFAPVLDAMANSKNIEGGFTILDLMHQHNVQPTSHTATSLSNTLTSTDAIDSAWSVLDQMKADGKSVGLHALNVLVRAAINVNDLQRAVGIYQAFPDFNVTPTVDTYNLLLVGCILGKNHALGDRLLSQMREAGINPTSVTYERLITLCLTQPTYEDAFFYLEEMKAAGFKPPVIVYESIIRKCVSVGDTRYNLAVEELLEQGYEMKPKLKAFIESGGRSEVREQAQKKKDVDISGADGSDEVLSGWEAITSPLVKQGRSQ